MKKIEYKDELINLRRFTGEDKEFIFSYKENLLTSLRKNIPEGGLSFADIETRLKLIDKIEKSSKELIIEDTLYSYLLKVVESEKWVYVDKTILNYINQIKNAQEV